MSRSKPGPAAHSHSVFLVPLVGLGRCCTSTRITVPATIGDWSWSAQCPRWPSLGCRPCQAETLTVPYRLSVVVDSTSGVGQVFGSAQPRRWPWRRGRPIAVSYTHLTLPTNREV